MKAYYSDVMISFSVIAGGKRVRIWFDCICDKGFLYTARSKEVIETIEATDIFKSGKIRLLHGDDDKQTTAPTNQEAAIIDVPGISRATEAVSFLEGKGHLGYLRSKEEIRKKALEMGYRFVDLK